jgi:hypothetical protein
VCDWLLKLLSVREPSDIQRGSVDALLRKLRLGTELEYKVQRLETATIAKRTEAKLVLAYQKWLECPEAS